MDTKDTKDEMNQGKTWPAVPLKETQRKSITLKIDADYYSALVRLAKLDDRSIASKGRKIFEKAIIDAVKASQG